MFDRFYDHPGMLFVVATLLPIASFLLLLLAGAMRTYLRRHRGQPLADAVSHMLGGETPGRGPAYVAPGAIGLACVCSVIGFVTYLGEREVVERDLIVNEDREHAAQEKYQHAAEGSEEKANAAKEVKEAEEKRSAIEGRWAGNIVWAGVYPDGQKDSERAAFLRVGYRIDSLSAIMFVMVTFIGTLIHLFSMGYMDEELKPTVEDHEIHTEHGHFHRRGRFGRFFLYLSLFCFSMLNLLLADNLFQIFVSWELVGVCSYLLIGFYYERTSASNAANKAFITNRIGDAGFIIGVLILWTYVGTLNFQEIFQRVRCPAVLAHSERAKEADRIVTADVKEETADGLKLTIKKAGEAGEYALLFPRDQGHVHFKRRGRHGQRPDAADPRAVQLHSVLDACCGGPGYFPGLRWQVRAISTSGMVA